MNKCSINNSVQYLVLRNKHSHVLDEKPLKHYTKSKDSQKGHATLSLCERSKINS